MEHTIQLPLTRKKAAALHSGDIVYLNGTMYTGRDAAHKRMIELLQQGKPLPFPIEDSTMYYVGPTPPRPGEIIGSAGPTTSYRMDAYSPALLALGQRGMIGKGRRSPQVIEAMKAAGAVYFGAIGGAGVLLASRIKACEVIAFEDLGTEAIHRLEVANFPLVVVIDSYGENLYETGPQAFLSKNNI